MSTLLSVADAVSLYSFSDAVSTVAYCYRVCLFYLFYYTPFKCFLNATQTPRGAKYPDTLLDVYDVVVWEVNAPLCWGIEPSQILDLYASCLGERHLDIGPGTGKFLFQAVTKKVVHLKDLSLFDFNTISLFRCKKRLNVRNLSVPTLNVRLFAGDIMESDPFLNPSISGPPYEWIEPNEFDSVSANFVLHCINKNDGIPSKEALFLNVSKVLKAGEVGRGAMRRAVNANDRDENRTRSYFRSRRASSVTTATILIPHTKPFRDSLR